MKLVFERSCFPRNGEWYFIWHDNRESERLALNIASGLPKSGFSSWFFCRDLRSWFKKWVFKEKIQ